jgi:hypothetical protein
MPSIQLSSSLRRAQVALAKGRPDLRVEFYYASWDASQRITINEVSG